MSQVPCAAAVLEEGGGHGSQSLNQQPNVMDCQAEQFIMLGTDVEFLAYPVRTKVWEDIILTFNISFHC